LNQTGAKSRLHHVNQDSVWKMRWNWYFAYKMISRIMTIHIRKTKFFIISVSKFKQYQYENCHFHTLSYCIDIELYLITFLSQFCNLAHPCTAPIQDLNETDKKILCSAQLSRAERLGISILSMPEGNIFNPTHAC
jgi:hypothetical protein